MCTDTPFQLEGQSILWQQCVLLYFKRGCEDEMYNSGLKHQRNWEIRHGNHISSITYKHSTTQSMQTHTVQYNHFSTADLIWSARTFSMKKGHQLSHNTHDGLSMDTCWNTTACIKLTSVCNLSNKSNHGCDWSKD